MNAETFKQILGGSGSENEEQDFDKKIEENI